MTYNTNAPNGLVPINSVIGSSNSQQTNSYPITATYASTMFTGDLVTLSTAATVIRASATTPALGVLAQVQYLPASNNSGIVQFPYWPGAPTLATGSTPVALVYDDPMMQFTIQETASTATGTGTPLTQAAVGWNANIVYTAGSTLTGISAVSLDNTTVTASTAQNLKIVGLDPHVGNALGAAANWIVQINNHIYKAGSVRNP